MLLRLAAFVAAACLCAGAASAQSAKIPDPVLPTDRRPWSMDDVAQAAVALHRMAQQAPATLPHYTIGSRSAFSRLTALSAPVDTAGTPLAARLSYLQRTVQTYEQVWFVYASVQRAHGGYDVEVAELSRTLMRASALLAAEAVKMDVPPGDAQAFADGMARMRAGLAEMLGGVVAMASDADVLSETARTRLLRYAAAEGEAIAPLLPPDQRRAVADDIAAALEGPATAEVAEALRALHAVFAAR